MNYKCTIPELNKEINEKVQRLIECSDYPLELANKHNNQLNNLANIHSWWLEFPKIRKEIFRKPVENIKELKKRLKNKSRQGKKAVTTAWEYLNGGSIIEEIDHDMVVNLGNIIEPINKYNKNLGDLTLGYNEGYRTVRASLGFAQHVPPNAVQVPQLMEKLFQKVKEIDSPLEAAIYVHLKIAGIQPLRVDGNKRLARLLQNRVLYEHLLPPATVPVGERNHYIDLLGKALIGNHDGDTSLVYPFYTYLAGKVNTHLDEIIERKRL